MKKTTNRKVLIVDDAPLNCMLIKTILNTYGYKDIVIAVNGQDAINKVELYDFWMIFMDIQMPVVDGIVATKYIRNNLKKTMPIIAITAYFDVEVESNGFNELIRKPFNIEKIKSILDSFEK